MRNLRWSDKELVLVRVDVELTKIQYELRFRPLRIEWYSVHHEDNRDVDDEENQVEHVQLTG